tara:strand:- start:259 stop:810 length:552 start_codon:yes stop_codon:yes gene_type:complete
MTGTCIMGKMREDRTTIENNGVPLETTYKNIIDKVYILYPTGGYHYFSLCSPSKKINQIYREPIWPWIKTLSNDLGIIEDTRYPRPTQRDPYPKLNLRIKGSKIQYLTNNQYPMKTFYMHLLVAKAFIPNKQNLPVIDHRDSISGDYRVSNLRWVTFSENNSEKRPRMGPDKMYDVQHTRAAV